MMRWHQSELLSNTSMVLSGTEIKEASSGFASKVHTYGIIHDERTQWAPGASPHVVVLHWGRAVQRPASCVCVSTSHGAPVESWC